jgi:hypothetical protein
MYLPCILIVIAVYCYCQAQERLTALDEKLHDAHEQHRRLRTAYEAREAELRAASGSYYCTALHS